MSGVIRFSALESNSTDWWLLDPEQHEEVCQLVEAHGFSRKHAYRVEYDVIDLPLLRISRYLEDEHGEPYLDGEHIAREAVEVPLRGKLPVWWQPEAAS